MTTVSAVTDDELALASSRGSREAFEILYERHHRGLYDLACRMLRDQDSAADVVQATFTNAWVNLQKRRVSGNVRAWLYAIARNTAISELRRGRRQVPLAEDELAESLPYAELDRERLPDPERAVLDQEVAQLVWDSAAALNAREYSLLDLHLRKGFTPEEMAGSLGLSRGNVHTMLFRLRRSLEESVTGVLLARRGRGDCPELDALLANRDSAILTMETRRLIGSHLEVCSLCQDNRRRFVSPAEIFAGLVLIPMPEVSRIAIWKAIAAALAAGGAGAGVATHGAQEAVRWLLHGARSAYGLGAAGVAVVAGVIVGALVLTSGGGGSGAGIEDPSGFASTSHEIGRASPERVVVVVWTPRGDADGYSVLWSRREVDLPDQRRDLPGDSSRTESDPLPDGSWYFHLRTEGDGNWTSTVHLGPFVIMGEAPTGSPAAGRTRPSPAVAGTSSTSRPTPTPTRTPSPLSPFVAASGTPPRAPVPTPTSTATPTPTPSAIPTPPPTPTPPGSPGPTPTSTATLTPTPTPPPTPTPFPPTPPPTPAPTPHPTPQPTPSTLPATSTPSPAPTSAPTPPPTPTPAPTPQPTPTPAPTPAPTGGRHDAGIIRLSSPDSPGVPNTAGPLTVVVVKSDSDHPDNVGVYLAFLPPGGASNPGACSPAAVLDLGLFVLVPDDRLTIKIDPPWACANPAAVNGMTWTLTAIADVHGDDFAACATLSQLSDGTCSLAVSDDDSDDGNNFETRERPRVVYP